MGRNLSPLRDVIMNMTPIDYRSGPGRTGSRQGPEIIGMPRPHEGVTQALLGSFRSVPTMPHEFTRLLERLR